MQHLASLFLLCLSVFAVQAYITQQHIPTTTTRKTVVPSCPARPCDMCSVHHVYEHSGHVETKVLASGSRPQCGRGYISSIHNIDCCHGYKVVACRLEKHHCRVHQTSPNGTRHLEVVEGDLYPHCPPGTISEEKGSICCPNDEIVKQTCFVHPGGCCEVEINKIKNKTSVVPERYSIFVGAHAACPLNYVLVNSTYEGQCHGKSAQEITQNNRVYCACERLRLILDCLYC